MKLTEEMKKKIDAYFESKSAEEVEEILKGYGIEISPLKVMEQETKTITMPLSEYNQLIQNSNKCFVELYGYTKEEIEELQSSRNASINNTIYWTNRYNDCEEKLSEAKEVIQNLKDTISKIESELSKYKSKKWYEFWK